MSCSEAESSPRKVVEQVKVVGNDRLSEGVGLLVLDAPQVAASVEPGQFVHLRVTEGVDPLLRRPFSVHRRSGERIEILYQVLGRGTRMMSELALGDETDVIGPLGRGWRRPGRTEHALLVAGGLGAAPMGMLVEQLAEDGVAVSVAVGAPSSDRLVARELFESVARSVEVATDDGSSGHRGYVTEVSARLFSTSSFDAVYVCGPEIMSRIVVEQAAAAGARTQVSLERLMACGVGACLSCVVSTTAGRKRACVDGPVFDAEEVLWDVSEIPPRH